MEQALEQAIAMRKSGEYKAANELLLTLAQEFPHDASIHYHCAWSFDLLGEESKALPFYENAIRLGLPSDELEGAFLGLGSTYRTLGAYKKSKKVFQLAMESFPHNNAIKTFYAMTLYNLAEHRQAMELLLRCLIETTSSKEIQSYQKAIDFYADKLDETWK